MNVPLRVAPALLAALAAVAQAHPGEMPEPPRAEVDLSAATASTRTVHVRGRDDLQSALDRAAPGDMLLLQDGATYRGPFTLPRKPGNGWIVIRGSTQDATPPGTRIRPRGASLPRLVASAESVIRTAPGAHHYRLVGLEIAPAPGTYLHNVVLLGDGKGVPEDLPHHIVIERCYIHGDPGRGSRRGVALNGAHLAVVDSFISDFKERTADSQAVAGWGGPGPILLQNNYLEAAGENVMFGGADPGIAELVPSDITIRKNRIAKLLTWNRELSDGIDSGWSVKNLLELKNARRVLVEGNLIENSWPDAQAGFGVVFTVRNQDLTAPWSTLQDVTFRRNLVRNVGAGVNILGKDDGAPSVAARRIAIIDNAFVEVGASRGSGVLFQILNGTTDLTIEGNSADQTGAIILADGAPHQGFVFRRNDAPHNEYGVSGTGTRPGRHTLEAYFPGATFTGNALRGGPADLYPRGNQFPVTDLPRRVRKSADEAPPGADRDAVCKALSPGDVPIDLCGAGPLALH